jgi:hypothetical protein
MNTVLEIEEHPLPDDIWGDAPQGLIFRVDDQSPSTSDHSTVAPPGIYHE